LSNPKQDLLDWIDYVSDRWAFARRKSASRYTDSGFANEVLNRLLEYPSPIIPDIVMPRFIKALPLLIAILLFAGCQEYSEPVDFEAETEVLRELGLQWAAAESNKDLDAALALYWDDAVMLVPNQNPIVGSAALRPAFEAFFQMPFTSLESGPVEIEIAESGEMAYSWANYYISVPGPEGSVTMSNKFIAVWTKRDGEWKISANMSNSNPPS